MSSEFHVYVEITALPGLEKDLLEALQSLSRDSLATPMCTRFEVLTTPESPSRYHLFESFLSKEIYPEHVATAHAQHFLNHVIPTYVAERSVIFLENTNLTS